MGNPNQPMDGKNGSHAICSECGLRYGSAPAGAIGMWQGKCAICGEVTGLADALHDFDVDDAAVETARHQAIVAEANCGLCGDIECSSIIPPEHRHDAPPCASYWPAVVEVAENRLPDVRTVEISEDELTHPTTPTVWEDRLPLDSPEEASEKTKTYDWESELDSLKEIVSAEVDWKPAEALASCDRLLEHFRHLDRIVSENFSNVEVDLDEDTLQRLNETSQRMGLSIDRIVNNALEDMLLRHASEKNQSE